MAFGPAHPAVAVEPEEPQVPAAFVNLDAHVRRRDQLLERLNRDNTELRQQIEQLKAQLALRATAATNGCS